MATRPGCMPGETSLDLLSPAAGGAKKEEIVTMKWLDFPSLATGGLGRMRLWQLGLAMCRARGELLNWSPGVPPPHATTPLHSAAIEYGDPW